MTCGVVYNALYHAVYHAVYNAVYGVCEVAVEYVVYGVETCHCIPVYHSLAWGQT